MLMPGLLTQINCVVVISLASKIRMAVMILVLLNSGLRDFLSWVNHHDILWLLIVSLWTWIMKQRNNT